MLSGCSPVSVDRGKGIPVINREDEADLKWSFGDGQCVFERSTFGAQLDGMVMYASGTEPCVARKVERPDPDDAGTGFGDDGDFCQVCTQRPSRHFQRLAPDGVLVAALVAK